MQVIKEIATVWRVGKRPAIKNAAIAIIKRKYPIEKQDIDEHGYVSYGGFHWTSLPRSEVLLRRVSRLVEKSLNR